MAIDRQSLYGIAGGLGAPEGQGFLGGLFSGLSGTLGGFARYTDQTHEQERQRIRDMIEERRYQERMAIENERLGLERRRVAVAEAPKTETQDPYATWVRKQEYRQAHPAPTKPDPFSTWVRKRQYEQTHLGTPKLPDDVRKRIELINQADPRNPEHVKRLEQIIKNPATPEEAEAAERKVRSGMNWMGQ